MCKGTGESCWRSNDLHESTHVRESTPDSSGPARTASQPTPSIAGGASRLAWRCFLRLQARAWLGAALCACKPDLAEGLKLEVS
eukprot:1161760-Pelagomonas_calceolata.AAC.1